MKLLRVLISTIWLCSATLIITLGLLLSVARLLLPEAGKYHDEVAAWVGDVIGQPVEIAALGAGWHGLGPSVELRGVTVLDAAGKGAVLRCASARIDINLWQSLLQWQFEPGRLTVRGLHLVVVKGAAGGISVMGLEAAPGQAAGGGSKDTLKPWLQHQDRLAIEDSTLEWRDLSGAGKRLVFNAVNLQLRNQGDRHRLDGTVDLPADLGRHLQVAADVRGDLFTPKSWLGQAFARGSALRLGEWWGDQRRFGITDVNGTADFELWSRWGDGVQQVEGDAHVHALRLHRQSGSAPQVADATPVAAQVAVADVRGGFRWQRRARGWVVDVDDFVIAHEGAPDKPAQLRVEYGADNTGGRIVRAGYSDLRAEDVVNVLQAVQELPVDVRQSLVAMAPHGELNDGYLHYRGEAQRPPRFMFHTRFTDLGWRPDAALPGARAMSGAVTTDGELGVVTFDTEKAELDLPRLFRAPLPVAALTGSVYWHHDGARWRVLVPNITAHNEDVKLKIAGYMDKAQADDSPYLELKASFGDGKGDHVSRYLPAKIMPAGTLAWLDKAIVNGRISGGSAHVYGRLADFPFDDGRGLFEVRFDVSDGILEYAPGWPRLEQVDTEILFHGRRFEARAASAKSLDSEVLRALVTIPDMTDHPAVLTVDGEARGPAGDVVRYVTESPLRDKLGAFLENVSAGGQSHLQLSLKLPLARRYAKVKGTLHFSDGTLLFNDAHIDLTHINGNLNFSDRGLAAEQIHADLFGRAVTVSAQTSNDQEGATTTFSAQGTMDAAIVARRFAPPLMPYVDGVSAWRGELRIPPKSAGWVELDVDSSLRGVAVNLPAPLGKQAQESRRLTVQLPLSFTTGKPIHVRYGEHADAQLVLAEDKNGLRAERGEVRFGPGVAVLPTQAGVRMVGALPAFDAGQWQPILAKENTAALRAKEPLVNYLDMTFGTLKVAGHELDKAQLEAERVDHAWNVKLDSEQAAGRIHLPDAAQAPLVMNMDRLYLPHFRKGGKDQPASDPRQARPLEINAKHFRYGALDLGELHLNAVRKTAGLSFDDIHAHSPQRDLNISGQWMMEEGRPQSSFKVVYDGDDAGGTLTALGFAGIIKGGKVHTDLQLNWSGAPADFGLARAKGSISFKIKDGRLLEVEPGAGRILGLLSFQALPRRLTLDFSDLFQKGFSFDTLAGSFTIEKGNAYTDNLTMDGPAARIAAHGRVGLAAEDYDQQVTVIPSVSAGLPIAGALAGGVGAGAAMWLVEKIIKPGIDKMTKVEYRVTGPWTNPTVTRITTARPEKQPRGHQK